MALEVRNYIYKLKICKRATELSHQQLWRRAPTLTTWNVEGGLQLFWLRQSHWWHTSTYLYINHSFPPVLP
jgi:hypothetical protein